jgi:hypothetical protein
MRALLVATLAVVLAVPAVAIADRGSSDGGARTTVRTATKQQRAKAKLRKAKRQKSRASRTSSIGDERELKGRIASLSPLRVGSLTCTVPAGMSLSAFEVGDFVEITCDRLGGEWVLRKLHLEDDDELEDDEREITGRIVSLTPLTVGSLTCTVPSRITLASFAVGDLVEITCDRIQGQWVLRKLEHEDRADDLNAQSDDHDDHDDHSGRGRGNDEDEHDNSGPGNGGDDRSGHGGSGDDNSGSGGGEGR